jgi:hypothetical protein
VTTTKLVAGALTASNILTTQLDALANNSGSALGSIVVNNDTNLDMIATAELQVDTVSATTADASVELWMIPALDGTNYSDWTSGASPRASGAILCGHFVMDGVTAAQRKVLRGGQFYLPPCDVKFAVINRSGTAFPASGSVVRISTWNVQTV